MVAFRNLDSGNRFVNPVVGKLLANFPVKDERGAAAEKCRKRRRQVIS
jgi:hypothetical protein